MSGSTLSALTHSLTTSLEGLNFSASALSSQELQNALPELAIVSAFIGAFVVAYAVLLKYKPFNKGLFQFSGAFYSGSIASVLPFTASYIPVALAVAGAYLRGHWVWLMFAVGYGLVPVADVVLGEDSYNPTKEEEAKLKKQVAFRVLTWLYVPVQIAATTYIASQVPHLSLYEFIGITISFGSAAGFGIGCVHELVHRPALFEFYMAIVSVTWTLYGHFPVEHIQGHHRRVATDEDPASSALGESLYAFLPRCLWGSLVSAWDIERRFLAKHNASFFSLRNRILWPYVGSALLVALHYRFFGTAGAVFFVLQGFISSLTLENVNYIEHYGLRRRRLFDDNGKPLLDKEGEPAYERPGWFHAWNSGDRLTNSLLFKIQRHPDHHRNAGRPYQILRTFKESPTYPTGYAGMVLLSWFPPLWRWVMDPLVDKAYRDREEMEKKGVNYFPGGANNISSAFKREGEGYFEPGSSPYDESFYSSDVQDASKKVFETSFNELEAAAAVAKPVSAQ